MIWDFWFPQTGISHRAGLVLTTTPIWFNNPWLHNQLILICSASAQFATNGNSLDGNPAAQAATDEGRSHRALYGKLKQVWSFICFLEQNVQHTALASDSSKDKMVDSKKIPKYFRFLTLAGPPDPSLPPSYSPPETQKPSP